eukprot:jgi/Galph1/1773/GphlegSOOS_G448.1
MYSTWYKMKHAFYSTVTHENIAHPLFKHLKVEDLGLVDPLTRIYTFAAGHTATGNSQAIKEDFAILPVKNRNHALEAVLQSLVFVGLPKVLNACSTLQQANLLPPKEELLIEREIGCQIEEFDSSNQTSLQSDSTDPFILRGQRAFQQIYSTATKKLQDRIYSFHPDLESWVLEFGYGHILSRPVLSLYQRELCAIAALVGQSVAPQLISHIRGAIQVGATKEQIHSILQQTQFLVSSQAQQEVDNIWITFQRSRGYVSENVN